jgi:hypothetical protein
MPRQGTPVTPPADRNNPVLAAMAAQEALVSDARAGLTPAQMVERKLFSMLRSTPLPASRLQSSRPRHALSERPAPPADGTAF